MKLKSFTFFLFAIVSIISACSQPEKIQTTGVTVAFYNVENLFDTLDTPHKIDEEFLPSSAKEWNSEKYAKKLEHIGAVLSSLNKPGLPDIIGLCEVENKKVVEDLATTGVLKKAGYKVVHEESPDMRGIDVALMYSPAHFKYISHEKLAVKFANEPDETTRDILYVKGISGNDTLHLFVNHWPSRRDGQEASESRRVAAANVLKSKVANITDNNPEAKVLIMGDFNDFPDNKSVQDVLNAGVEDNQPLYNLMYKQWLKGIGTYNYKGNWNMLDQIIVSQGLLNAKSGLDVDRDSGHIYREEWILYINREKDIETPNRTYGGNRYYGGYSDHLPVYVNLVIK